MNPCIYIQTARTCARDVMVINEEKDHDTHSSNPARSSFHFTYFYYAVYYAYTYTNTYISGNINKDNDELQWTNEHTSLQKYISYTLFSMFLWCMRDEWRQGQTAILTKVLLLTKAALLPHLGWGCSTGGRWGPHPSVCKLVLTLAFLSPFNSTAVGTCLYSFITPTCFRFFFRLFTLVHLLIDRSVKGQYITITPHKGTYPTMLSLTMHK